MTSRARSELTFVCYLKTRKARVFSKSREGARGGVGRMHVEEDAQPIIEKGLQVCSSSRNVQVST